MCPPLAHATLVQAIHVNFRAYRPYKHRRPHDLPTPTDGSLAPLASGWEQRRHWYAPAAHRMLRQHMAARSSSQLESSLAHSHHAYLLQHIVSGRSILPGAAMFEAAFAAAAVLLPEELQRSAGLEGAAIAAPLLLKQLGASGSSVSLHMTVQHASGSVQLSSQPAASGRRSQPTVHLQAVAAAPHASVTVTAAASAGIVPATALPLSLSQVPQAGSAWVGEAVGSVCQQPLLPQLDSYHCHPAAVDAATHFGAAFDLSLNTAARVPVALGRYTAGSTSGSTGGQHLAAFASTGRLLQDGSRVSSFGIAAGGSRLLQLAQLQSRPLGSQPAAAAPKAQLSARAAERLATECWTYQTIWQATQPQLASSSSAVNVNVSAALLLESGGKRASVAKLPSSLPAAALASYAATLRMLHTLKPGKQQQLTATGSASGAQHGAPVAAAGSRACVAAAGMAALPGLLKVAAPEEPAWRLGLQLADPAAPLAAGTSCTDLPAADVHGTAAASSAAFVPRMQLAAEQLDGSSSIASPAPLSPGCHVISGGMGGLGELTACHLAHEAQQDSRLLLLGRTGRFPAAASALASEQRLLQTSGSVVMLQADAAAAADTAGVTAQLALGAAPVASFIHAAGLLADKLLPNQRLADARIVFAPKLAALAAALPALQLQPMQQLLLFSSVSAALGNRGQANYAAANAALDGAATTLAGAGCRAASLQWGAWAGAGMAAQTPQLLARLNKQGEVAEQFGIALHSRQPSLKTALLE